MKTRIRILFISSICLIFLFGYLNYFIYVPPQNVNNYYSVSSSTLIKNTADYEGFNVIVIGIVDHLSIVEEIVIFEIDIGNVTINCTQIDMTGFTIGDEIYFRGISYLETKGYVLVYEYHYIESYSLEISLIALIIVFLILLIVLKFNWKSFSFEIRRVE